MFYDFQNRLILQGALTATTALRIGAGRNTDATGSDLPVLKDTLNQPFIPGSSFKGVLRSRIESLLRTLRPGRRAGACNPLADSERCITPTEIKAQKERFGSDDAGLTTWVHDNTCMACQLFGSPWLASRVQVRDWLVDKDYWFDQFLVRDGVAINRDTETAQERQLYSYEVIPAGTRFTGMIMVENATTWQLGLLFAGLHEFAHGLPLGGATSRGLGSIVLAWDAEKSRYVKEANLWAYLAEPEQAGEPYTAQLPAWRAAMLAEFRPTAQPTEEAHA